MNQKFIGRAVISDENEMTGDTRVGPLKAEILAVQANLLLPKYLLRHSGST